MPLTRFNSPLSFKMRTICNTSVVACEWGDTMAPPRRSSSSASASGVQVSWAATVVGEQVAQKEVGRVVSAFGTTHL